MATVTIGLHQLLGRAELGLTQVSGPRPDRPIRWVHICELRDPGHYLTGGELLLTAGVDFPATRAEVHRYVRRLVAAGAAALGFGVTPVHDELPPDLVTACRRHGLPLLVVPRRTSFLVISQVVSLMLAEQERAGQQRISLAQAALTRAATRADGVAAVVRQLASALGGWAVLLDARQRLSTGGAVPGRAVEVEELAGRLLVPGGPAAATAHRDGGQVVAQALGRTGRVLVVGREAGFATADRAILEVGVALLTVLGGVDRLPAPVGESVTALLAVVLDGAEAEVEPQVAAVAGVAPGGWWRVVRARQTGASADAARVEVDRAEVAARLGTPLVGPAAGGGVRALVPVADDEVCEAGSAAGREGRLADMATRGAARSPDSAAGGGVWEAGSAADGGARMADSVAGGGARSAGSMAGDLGRQPGAAGGGTTWPSAAVVAGGAERLAAETGGGQERSAGVAAGGGEPSAAGGEARPTGTAAGGAVRSAADGTAWAADQPVSGGARSSATDRTGSRALAEDPRWLVAESVPVRWPEVPAAARRVERLLRHALARGRSLAESPRGGLDGLVPAAEAAEFARARLAPLADHPAPLAETLRAWLGAGGNWESTAEVLGVHRNTVRHRVAAAARLLDCDPQDADTRAELWLALRWLPEG